MDILFGAIFVFVFFTSYPFLFLFLKNSLFFFVYFVSLMSNLSSKDTIPIFLFCSRLFENFYSSCLFFSHLFCLIWKANCEYHYYHPSLYVNNITISHIYLHIIPIRPFLSNELTARLGYLHDCFCLRHVSIDSGVKMGGISAELGEGGGRWVGVY